MKDNRTSDAQIIRRFIWAITFTSITLIAETAGGIWTNSLALLSDAAHVFLDLFALVIALVAIKLAALPPTETRTYGWHRLEVFASFINGLTIFFIAIGIFYEAWHRALHPEAVNSLWMLVIAVIGLLMNLISAFVLHGHGKRDLNVHSAFLHVIGDAAASAGVIIGGIIMLYSNWYTLDAIISAVIGFIVIFGAWRVLRDSTHILLEGVPRSLNLDAIVADIVRIEGVRGVHHLNVWEICSHVTALSAHVELVMDDKNRSALILNSIETILREKFHITHTTLQMECVNCVDAPVLKNLSHGEHAHD